MWISPLALRFMAFHRILKASLLITAFIPATAFAFWENSNDLIDTMLWGWSATQRVKLFNGPDGSLTMYSLVTGRTALDLGPSRASIPTADALAEVVLYRTADQGTNMERMNWTAGAAAIPHYRFGVEKSGTGQYRDMVFAFEETSAGTATMPLRMLEPNSTFSPNSDSRVIIESKAITENLKSPIIIPFKNETGAFLFRKVEIGSADSCGTGYRCLRVPN